MLGQQALYHYASPPCPAISLEGKPTDKMLTATFPFTESPLAGAAWTVSALLPILFDCFFPSGCGLGGT